MVRGAYSRLCILLACLDVTSGSFANETFTLGIVGPYASASQQFLAAAVMFDLDFRKNSEPELVRRFGEPIVQVQDINPNLQIRPIFSFSGDEMSGMRTMLDWLPHDAPRAVDGIIGGLDSILTGRMLAVTAEMQVPQVAWRATSPLLSDRQQYPYFARTVASDAAEARAVWAWMQHFQVPALNFMYSSDEYAGGLLVQATVDAADSAEQRFRIHRIACATEVFSNSSAIQCLYEAKATGSRFLLLALPQAVLTSMLHVMEMEDMLYNGVYQTLALSWFQLKNQTMSPSNGLPVGFQQLKQINAGEKFGQFSRMWSNMTLDDVNGTEAKERYGLNEMLESVEEGSAQMFDELEFATASNIDPVVSFLFDAGYTFVIALNNMLNSGTPLRNISADAVWRQIRATCFEGVSGTVSFDEKGERLGSFSLQNLQAATGTTSMVHIGTFTMASGTFVMEQSPVWVTGEESAVTPSGLLTCLHGFETDLATGMCSACQAGVGCGYRPEDGFPIGVYGPFTSVTQSLLASAVLVDLDLRKHTDPSLVDRFGPPLVAIPNMHPDLKIKLQIGTSDSKVDAAMETTLNWMLGTDHEHRVAAFCGGYHSALAGPVASNAAVFKTPQVIWGASSAALSDRELYPFITRVVSPDDLQAAAVWAWMNHFEVPAAGVLYAREAFSSGLFQGLMDIAGSAGQSSRLAGISYAPLLGQAGENIDAVVAAVESLRNTGMRFVITFPPDAGAVFTTLDAFEMLGMFQTHHLLGADSVDGWSGSRWPTGLHWLRQQYAGSLYPRFLSMWRSMMPDDMYSAEAQQRYYRNLLVNPMNATAPLLTEDDFLDGPGHYNGYLVDSVYLVVLAINSLLNANVTPPEIYGEKLQSEMRQLFFEGVTGPVTLDENFDRVGDYLLTNVKGNGTGLETVAVWNSGTNEFTFLDGVNEIRWMSGSISALAPDELVACAPGQHWDEATGLCIACAANWYSLGGVREQSRCIACPAGFVSEVEQGATGCIECLNGTFRTIADEQCTACPLGTYGSNAGQSSCLSCPVGTFSDEEGSLACEACGVNSSSRDSFTTMARVEVNGFMEYSYITGATSSSMCGCDKNTRQGNHGECVACGEGMVCKGMNDVSIKQGYFAEASLSIFRCHSDSSRCTGGLPGQTCAAGRTGIACAECEPGKTPAPSGGCKECEGNDVAPMALVSLWGLLSLVGVYYVIDSSERVGQSHTVLLCGIAFGQLVTVTQQLGAVGMLSVEWKEPVRSLMRLVGLFAFDIEVLRTSCVKSQGPLERFTMKVSIIFVTVAYMGLVHCFFVTFRHHGYFRRQMKSLVGAIGSMFMVFYISVTTTVLQPLQCQEHPNGKWTIRSYPSVICWDTAEHKAMLTIGTLAFLAVPVAFLVAACFVVRQFPKRMRAGDTAFLQAFAFLFVRFRPSQHPYILVQLLRSFLIAVVLIIPDLAVQVFALQLVLLAGYTLSLHLLPFRVMKANVMDCVFAIATLSVVCLTAFFLEDDQLDLAGLSWLTFCIMAMLLMLAPGAILYAAIGALFCVRKPFQFFLCHHKNGSGAYTRLLKMSLKESPKVRGDVFVDSDNLDNLDRLFDYVANSTSTLVAIVSEELFTRPWCVGEMCTAKQKKVSVVLAALPSGILPDEQFIEELELRVANLEVLTENGIGRDLLCDMLRWIPHQPTIHIPSRVTHAVMATLVERLVRAEAKDITEDGIEHTGSVTTPTGTSSVMMLDTLNMEAAATALILRTLLMPLMHHKSNLVPRPVQNGEISLGVSNLVVICTNGLFESVETHKVLLQAQHIVGCTFLPLLCEQAFRFPQKDFASQLQRLSTGLSAVDANAIGQVVAMIFKEIGINFQAQHDGQSRLCLAAEDVARRLTHPHKLKATTTHEALSLPYGRSEPDVFRHHNTGSHSLPSSKSEPNTVRHHNTGSRSVRFDTGISRLQQALHGSRRTTDQDPDLELGSQGLPSPREGSEESDSSAPAVEFWV